MKSFDVGIIGLGVMGASLARNFASRRIRTVGYNRTAKTARDFVREHGGEFLDGTDDLKAFVKSLKKPRRIILMVSAGDAVDAVAEQLFPLLSKGDIIVDGGNSHFADTVRRQQKAALKKIEWVGCGISGGEEGALNGPSMMPGGSASAWKSLRPLFEKIAARDTSGGPCVTHIGPDGAGHYVKMVHNGIEYAVMQLMAEAYDLLKTAGGLSAPEIATTFKKWNRGPLQSFLFEIAVEVLSKKDEFKDGHAIDFILDRAGQKGTGRWTAEDAIARGVAIPSLAEAVTARALSSLLDDRRRYAKFFATSNPRLKKLPRTALEKELAAALHAGMILAYAQGYELIRAASREYGWNINLAELSRIWEGGCIIRAKLLGELRIAYKRTKTDRALLDMPSLQKTLRSKVPALRRTVQAFAVAGIPAPVFFSSLMVFDALTQARGSANFIQGLRDHFGAHTYERIDRKGTFHTQWSPLLKK